MLRLARQVTTIIQAALFTTILACGQTTGPDDLSGGIPVNKNIVVSPAKVDLTPGEQVQFKAVVKNKSGKATGASVFWTAIGGNVSLEGLYTAGQRPGTYWVKAVKGKDIGEAVVRILETQQATPQSPDSDPVPTSILISPTEAQVLTGEQIQFSATVLDQNGKVMLVSVSWKATGGSITSSGKYTAGSTPGTYEVTATTNSLSAKARVAVDDSPPEPSSGVSIYPGESIQAAVDRYPAGTAFRIEAGVHRQQSVVPKNGMTFVGARGAVLDGEKAVEHAFRGDKHSGARAGVDNVTIRGLEIRNYNSPLRNGAIRAGGPNDTENTGWVIENCDIHDNAGGGIRTGHRMIIRGNKIRNNGQIGIIGSGDNVLVVDNEIAYNNTRDIKDTVGLYEFGGTKFVKTRNLVVRNNYVHHNLEDGLWFDIDNVNAMIEGNRVVGNTRSGIHYEISYDAVIRNNYVEGNTGSEYADNWHRGGIRISSSANVEVYGNTVVGNANGIVALTQNRGSGALGKYEVKNLYVHDNTIEQSRGVATGLGLGGQDAPEYYSARGNRWERNSYYLPDTDTVKWHWESGKIDWGMWIRIHKKDGE